MKGKARLTGLALALLLALVSTTAWGNDKIISTVTPVSGPTPIIEVNGVAQGNIRLNYTVQGTTFPCGPFAEFDLGLEDQRGTGQGGTYPAELKLSVSGNGTPVQLLPSPDEFSVGSVGWKGSSRVTVYINCSKVSTTPSDGDVLDGQMNESTPPQAHLDTITTVQVHITLAVPTADCLKLYSFESYQDTGDLLSHVDVRAPSGNVRSTNPGQVSVDAMVVNTCQWDKSFDLLVSLDPDWQTNPSGNPGNATFTYTTAGEYDLSTYNFNTFDASGTETKQGQKLCLTNLTLPAGDSFLTRVHSAIKDGLSTSDLPIDGDFDFSATLYSANTTCTGDPLAGVGPINPDTSHLTYTVK